mmetsp:Transcript_12460/g.18708  ORF Transcript_12460/g.18708 Transcript_12460/m.18708 type:complete len:305 (+) Transcript_12460:680-1594(+)
MLGEALAAIYSQYISIEPDKIYARSTNTARTKQSAEAFIRGLLTLAVETGTINILTSVNEESDVLRPQPTKCPALKEAFENITSSDHWKENMFIHKNLSDSLNEMLDIENSSDWMSSFDHLFDNIQSRHCHGMPLPCKERNGTSYQCVSQEQRENLYEAASWEFRYKFGGSIWHSKIAKLGSGPLITKLIENLNKSAKIDDNETNEDSTNGKQLFLYFGHDDTIGGLLSALHLKGWNWPPYASNMIWELWSDALSLEPFVRVLYNGKVMTLPFCSQKTCLLEQFVSWLKMHAISDDMESDCKLN